MTDRWEEYATGSRVEHFAWWCEEFLTQSIDQFAGEPLTLEDWQLEIMGEALATADSDGVAPHWRKERQDDDACGVRALPPVQ